MGDLVRFPDRARASWKLADRVMTALMAPVEPLLTGNALTAVKPVWLTRESLAAASGWQVWHIREAEKRHLLPRPLKSTKRFEYHSHDVVETLAWQVAFALALTHRAFEVMGDRPSTDALFDYAIGCGLHIAAFITKGEFEQLLPATNNLLTLQREIVEARGLCWADLSQ